MRRRDRRVRAAACAAVLVFAFGCATERPGAFETFEIRTDATSNDFDVEAWGREAILDLRTDLRGAALTELRVWIEGLDGRRASAAPAVDVVSTAPIAVVASVDRSVATLRFDPPIFDDVRAALRIVAPDDVTAPYRVRATAVVRR